MKSVRMPVQAPREALTFPLRQAARLYPNKVAVVEPEVGGREWTYAVLEDRSSALAASLADLGIKPGDRVALWMKNSVEYILSFYGILKAGAIVAPASTHYLEREVIHQLQVTEAAGIITTEESLVRAPQIKSGAFGLRFVISDKTDDSSANGKISFSSLFAGKTHVDRSVEGDCSDSHSCSAFFQWDHRITQRSHAYALKPAAQSLSGSAGP